MFTPKPKNTDYWQENSLNGPPDEDEDEGKDKGHNENDTEYGDKFIEKIFANLTVPT